jgi:hypothetical protein
MYFKRIRKYFDKINKKDKIQSKEMEKDMERSEDIKEAYLQGGKAIGEIVKKKTQKK